MNVELPYWCCLFWKLLEVAIIILTLWVICPFFTVNPIWITWSMMILKENKSVGFKETCWFVFFIYINLSTNLTSRRWGSRSPQRVRRKGPLLRRLARSEVSAGADPREVPGAAEHALPGPCQLDRASRHRQDVHRHAKRQKRWVQSPCQIGGKYF